MPRRTDLKKILLIGSGPIVIGQACEFDYSGTQACKALREEGYTVVLVNSNPATIMTDPEIADRTYIEPITWEMVARVIERERPDALLPTLGGQTALNTAMKLHEHGVLAKYGVEMIGATPDAIDKAENREHFKAAMEKIGIGVAIGGTVHTLAEAQAARDRIGLPCVLRPSFTMGGSGGGIAYNVEEFNQLIARGLDLSPTSEVLIEQSIIGWKEYELEVMRDNADNVVIVCSIENLDPMGVHTGDSITVAPAQTLTDKEYQRMRDAAQLIIREIGVETGGSNIQFAINPANGDMIAIEMNPRVSRSSALASKATGFPIAKIAAKLAVGYRLDELKNDITRETPACFEPTIDYVVTKVPRWAFEKFPDADTTLTTQMKSVGETMAIGRTFKESLQKALRGLETGRFGLGCDRADLWGTPAMPTNDEIVAKLYTPTSERIWYVRYALKAGMTAEYIHEVTKIDPWFLGNIRDIVEPRGRTRALPRLREAGAGRGGLPRDPPPGEAVRLLRPAVGPPVGHVGRRGPPHRKRWGIVPVFKCVDTCAAEFEAYTPYYYSSYETPFVRVGDDGAAVLTDRERGPPHVGQGPHHDPGRRPQPHRPGDRVRLLLLPGRVRPARGGVRDHHGQQQPRDGQHRLRHVGPPLLRAADRRGRAEHLRRDAAGGPDRAVRRADAAEPRQGARGGRRADHRHERRTRSTSPRTASVSANSSTGSACSSRPTGSPSRSQEAIYAARRIGFPVLVGPSYVLGGRAWRSSTTSRR